jgi:hypothetical protein
VTGKTKNESAKVAALSDCNKPVGQLFHNLAEAYRINKKKKKSSF